MNGTTMLGLADYARKAGASERTVKRWLAADALAGAYKRDGVWSIPADAEPLKTNGGNGKVIVQEPLLDVAVSSREVRAPEAQAFQEPGRAFLSRREATPAQLAAREAGGGTLVDALDREPALIPAERAGAYVGVPAATVRTLIHQGVLVGVQVGAAHTWHVTQGSIRKLAGL